MVLPIKERYSYNYDIFRNHFLNSSDRIKKSWQKHTVVLRAQRDGYVTKQDLFDKLEPINSHQGNADFSLIIVIRLLFVADQNEVSASGDMKGLSEDVWSLSDAAAEIQTALSRFHFWPESGKNSQKVGETLRNTIFWSENHLLMTLSSAYLYEQRRLNDPLELQKMRTTHLLLTYLKAHCSPAFGCVGFKSDGSLGGGFYEALAHTYLPYSMSALLNLYDFAEDEEVRVMSAQLLHCIAFQLLLVTVIVPSTDGDLAIASLSGRSISLLFHPQPSNYYTTILYFTASCRSFARTRLRKTDLNINQFINLVLYYANHVSSPDQPVPSAISDFLLTSSWRPDQLLDKAQTNSIYQALEFQGSLQVCVSHPMQLIQDLYEHICSANNYDKAINDLVPFYWSAGLIAHPDYVTHTKKYRKEKGLQNNVHLKMLTSLSFLPSTFLDTYDILSKGQNYSGVNLSLYKAPEVCLTSFKGFNPHIASFQQVMYPYKDSIHAFVNMIYSAQNPWMANISGAGVWSQTGSEGGKFAGFGMTNTHLPFAQQHNSLLLLSYIA